jgi:hypothetical protein
MFREFDVETTNNMYFLINYSIKICIKYHNLWYFHSWGTQKGMSHLKITLKTLL